MQLRNSGSQGSGLRLENMQCVVEPWTKQKDSIVLGFSEIG